MFFEVEWACSSVRLERTPDKREVDSSILSRPTILGGLAQLGERLPCTQEVSGSIPLSSTIINYELGITNEWIPVHEAS